MARRKEQPSSSLGRDRLFVASIVSYGFFGRMHSSSQNMIREAVEAGRGSEIVDGARAIQERNSDEFDSRAGHVILEALSEYTAYREIERIRKAAGRKGRGKR